MIDFAEHIERMGDSLACFIESTAPDRWHWRPETSEGTQGRSLLELAGECIATNQYVAALLRSRGSQPPDRSAFTSSPQNAEQARAQLVASSKEFADAVRQLTPEAFNEPVPHWRGPIPAAYLIVGAYRNMAYHAGQINLIQILGGDSEFHMPPTWY